MTTYQPGDRVRDTGGKVYEVVACRLVTGLVSIHDPDTEEIGAVPESWLTPVAPATPTEPTEPTEPCPTLRALDGKQP